MHVRFVGVQHLILSFSVGAIDLVLIPICFNDDIGHCNPLLRVMWSGVFRIALRYVQTWESPTAVFRHGVQKARATPPSTSV